MISLIIPCIDNHEFTRRAISYAWENAVKELDIIIIDNASDEPYHPNDYPYVNTIIRNPVNLGVPASMKQAAEVAETDVLVYIHNDVYIHEEGWDLRIRSEFNNKPNLGMAGFFGAPGVMPDGGRRDSMSNMLGLVGGSQGWQHGLSITGEFPASVLDGLCMIFRASVMDKMDFSQLPTHHWYDRIIPLMNIAMGYDLETIGIAFDHDTGGTAAKKQYHESSITWLKEHGIQVDSTDIDGLVYGAGLEIFNRDWAWRLPLSVDDNFNYRWGN